MGQNNFAAWPVAFYGGVLLSAAIAYFILAHVLISYHGRDSALAKALGKDIKGKASLVCYAAAIPLSFVSPLLACALYVLVAVMWPTTPGETRNTKVTRGYAHGVPQRLRDAVNSLERGKRLISATPTLRQAANMA
jgi:hypothetical protein